MSAARSDREIAVGSLVSTRIRVRVPGRDAPHPAGARGWVCKSPDRLERRYRVRFTDGTVCDIEGEFLRPVVLDEEPETATTDLGAWVILQCVTGPVAWGVAEAEAEADIRGIYLPPATLHWSFGGVPDRLEDRDGREVIWELAPFLRLAASSDPDALEVLHSPLVEYASPLGDELIDNRQRFVSRQLASPYVQGADRLLDRLKRQVRLGRGIAWDEAAELVRLLLTAIGVFEDGEVRVDAGTNRDALIAIRRGEMAWVDVDRWRMMLEARLEAALQQTSLPARIDLSWVDAFLVRARKSMA